MASSVQLAVVGVLAAVAGFAVGRAMAPQPQAAPEPPPAKTTDPAPVKSTKPAPGIAPERLEACEEELDQCNQLKEALGHPFPDQGLETQAAWQTMVGSCDLEPWSVAMADCSEYPCAATLHRTEGAFPTGPERVEQRLAVEAKLRECDAVKQALGQGFPEGAVAAIPLHAECGGKPRGFWGIAVLDPKGEAFEMANADDETQRESDQVLAWFGRRAAVLQLKFPCD